MSHDEHKRVVEICVETAAGRVPVIAGAGSNNTAEAIDLARHAEKAGADAVLVVTPYYNKPSQEGLYQHFKAINDAIDIPIIIYNIPPRSVIDMSVETMARLFQLKNIVGVKDATAKIERVSLQRQAMGPDFIQLSGEDATALGFNAHGGHGCISVTANVAPKLSAEFQDACLSGDYATALQLSGPADAASPGAVPRAESDGVEVCALGARQDERRDAAADGSGVGACEGRDPRGDGARRTDQLNLSNGKRSGRERPAAENRRARFNYEIGQVFEAGIQLAGSEVKSLREGRSNIADSYAGEKDGELFLYNAYIPEYLQANRFKHETRRPRKLLLHKREIERARRRRWSARA